MANPEEKEYGEEIQRKLKIVVDHFQLEDRAQRELQLREWRRLKLMWEGFTNVYYSEVAHDWRIYDAHAAADSQTDQSYYDKPVNIFRAYLESIIAALSVTVPPITCYPDDADNPLDLLTAKAADKVAALIYRHNDVSLVWIHALFVYCTEGAVACHNYIRKSKDYGTYKQDIGQQVQEKNVVLTCPDCGYELDRRKMGEPNIGGTPAVDEMPPPSPEMGMIPPTVVANEMQPLMGEVPQEPGLEECPACGSAMMPEENVETVSFTEITGHTEEAKSRVCIEAYGGLNVKMPIYARKQSEMPYLFYSYETHFANMISEYPHLFDDFGGGKSGNGTFDEYEAWARRPFQYLGGAPDSNVTIRQCWLRPCAFNVLETQEEVNELLKEFPEGCRVDFVNDTYAKACTEKLDDYWAVTYNPLADYIQHEPLGLLLVSIQEITNDILSLTVQTMEHGISQTFVDPAVVNFNQYGQTEVIPGGIYPATPKSGRSLNESFYEVKTATLSHEVMPFASRVDSLGQLVSGALPSLFGGQMQDSRTASEYSMSRSQAMQRLQNTYKMFTIWWKQVFTKAIPKYLAEMKDDERWVEKDKNGGFLNMYIRKAETEGKVGRVELEANENIPLNWAQQKDVIMELLQNQNEQILGIIGNPENLPYLKRALGLTDLFIPGEDDREKQYEEINLLLNSEPIQGAPPVDPLTGAPQVDPMTGMPVEGMPEPSIPIDPEIDNHQVEFDICRNWLVGAVGREAKTSNPPGYMNVLLHAKQHLMQIQMMMMQQAPPPEGKESGDKGSNPDKPSAQDEPPVSEDADVQTVM